MNKLLAALAWTLAAPAFAQEDFSKIEVKAIKLTDTVYMLEGAGGNIGLSAGEDSVFVVDDQFAPLTPKISAAIARIIAKPGVTKDFDEKWGKGFLKPEQFTAMLVGGMRKGS